MPQIIVTAGSEHGVERAVTLRERINATDFESDRFTANLLERLGWAVEDATAAERRDLTAEHHLAAQDHRPAERDMPTPSEHHRPAERDMPTPSAQPKWDPEPAGIA